MQVDIDESIPVVSLARALSSQGLMLVADKAGRLVVTATPKLRAEILHSHILSMVATLEAAPAPSCACCAVHE